MELVLKNLLAETRMYNGMNFEEIKKFNNEKKKKNIDI